ncbi:MAG: TonB-dependent receptor [Novosphingobium sp. 28-62-57]|uniref:TonB-dependent receptor n=1 Tax=unclassified Novosphingobium TaxID=2644732 RepID=UPI000BCE5ACC|nr:MULTISPECIES: TonB-dependent receptor [unclassified Novosphingobium]OYW48887.1 MAG: TonB-dependent receptor [Novosphingobium sp. 12-62-10]OYZ12616.1 MAG: TonB-dependent receptor [Novosphingobium sp. 28-62-57]
MRGKLSLLVGVCAAAVSVPAFSQEAPQTADDNFGLQEIIVTAQRQAQSLQAVPIAVSAFSAENLEKQQIQNPSDLQLSLPNVTFTKTNFTSSSFTIRGIGDLCVGVSCDAATGIHLNDMPMVQSRLFETEFFDLERIEVLRGPQGTLFGRNATSGVVNVITAKPDLSGFGASGDIDYGKYNSVRARGMVNVPLGETLGIRLAGMYNKRDGFTRNLATNSRIDGRDMYAFRGSLRWEPSSDTTVDLSAYYFRENDNRSRIQKQLCHRDPTGILGCLPDKLANETTNADSTLASLLSSREFFGIAVSPSFAALGLGSIYGTDGDGNSGVVNPADVRTVDIDYLPTYFAQEEVYQGKLQQALGNSLTLNVTAGFTRNTVRSRSDYNLARQRSLVGNPGLFALAAFAQNPALGFAFAPIAQRLIPNGPTGQVCQSDIDPNNVGVYGAENKRICANTSLDFDESSQEYKQYAAEAHIDSDFDGMFNFLIGANYLRGVTTNNSYYVNSFGLDYAAGILGAAAAASGAFGPQAVFRPSPFFRSNTDRGTLDSYGIFGETYFKFNDKVKLTLGLRYNHDKKFTRARTTLLSDGLSSEFAGGNAIYALVGAASLENALNFATADFDKGTPGVQPFQERSVSFGRFTGRAVLDVQLTPDNLIYLSYSRGYKSGGINPPLSVGSVNDAFRPESVDSFEIGSKNRFGSLQLNLSGFYYRYKDLQLSRITARTSVNDNINADIYGVEAEAIVAPTRNLLINMSASYLKTKVVGDQLFVDTRDPSAGRSDTVLIKDITLGSICAVTGPNATAANAFVNTINGGIGLQPATPIPGTNTTGAFSICGALAGQAAAIGNQFGGIRVSSGIEKNVRGNELPQAPEFKWSAGIQYTLELGDMSLVPRFDINYTGESYGTIFNGNINRIKGYEVMNAQIQLNGRDDRWFLRGYIQNLGNNNATTGLYVTDQSSGLFTNIFTLEPRRYGVAAGFKF